MLVLDEPTNHLDLMSREWIEEAVEAFTGTLLFVSHDRYFVSRFATRIIYLENGTYTDFTGNYEAFLAYRERQKAEQAASSVVETPKKAEKQEKPKPKGGTKNIAKKVAVLEREISQLEERMSALENEMAAVSYTHLRGVRRPRLPCMRPRACRTTSQSMQGSSQNHRQCPSWTARRSSCG